MLTYADEKLAFVRKYSAQLKIEINKDERKD